jgi:hypothetical protein
MKMVRRSISSMKVLNQAREALREFALAAQQAEFAQRSHENRIEELKRNISTALEQSAQLFASMEQGQLELDRSMTRPRRRVAILA